MAITITNTITLGGLRMMILAAWYGDDEFVFEFFDVRLWD